MEGTATVHTANNSINIPGQNPSLTTQELWPCRSKYLNQYYIHLQGKL